MNVEVLFEDEWMIVVDKPSGLLSVPGKGVAGEDSVVSRVLSSRLGVIDHPAVHRLDMDTSGILMLAKTRDAHRHLSCQFQEGRVQKFYIALLDGMVADDEGVIELKFRLDVENRPYQIYDEVHGKLGVTHWKKLEVKGGMTRVEFSPKTGRTHQLRVHSADKRGLGCPIMGDTLYGGHLRHGELKLHAARLICEHPVLGERLCLEAPVPF